METVMGITLAILAGGVGLGIIVGIVLGVMTFIRAWKRGG